MACWIEGMATSGQAWRLFRACVPRRGFGIESKVQQPQRSDRPRGPVRGSARIVRETRAKEGEVAAIPAAPAWRAAHAGKDGEHETPTTSEDTRTSKLPSQLFALSCHCFFCYCYLPSLQTADATAAIDRHVSSIRTVQPLLQPVTIIALSRSSLQPGPTSRKLRIASVTSIQSAA